MYDRFPQFSGFLKFPDYEGSHNHDYEGSHNIEQLFQLGLLIMRSNFWSLAFGV